jgi:DNA polymerase III delta prime subunit
MFPDCRFEKEEVIKTITINKFVKDNNIERIDLMWLDLQGNEYKALSKADKILPTVKAIYAEYSLIEFYEGVMLYDEFKEYMSDLGFDEVINEKMYNYIGVGNSLFVRK